MKCKLLFIVLFLSGCSLEEERKELKKLREATTVRSTYYLTTVVHDEHLFIISHQGHFLHHPDCPCFKAEKETATKEEVKSPTPTIIFDLLK